MINPPNLLRVLLLLNSLINKKESLYYTPSQQPSLYPTAMPKTHHAKQILRQKKQLSLSILGRQHQHSPSIHQNIEVSYEPLCHHAKDDVAAQASRVFLLPKHESQQQTDEEQRDFKSKQAVLRFFHKVQSATPSKAKQSSRSTKKNTSPQILLLGKFKMRGKKFGNITTQTSTTKQQVSNI